jgi:methionyl-tRNA synthetase
VSAAPGANETSGTLKRKAAAAKKSAQNPTDGQVEVDGPKSAEVLALDAKIAEQGGLVRELKAKTPRTKELEEAAIAELKRLKAERAALSK